MKPGAPRFWEDHSLDEMDDQQWESLCDGCGRCCLHKLQHPDSGEVVYTDVACRLLDLACCRCASYATRTEHVPECTHLRTTTRKMLEWLPVTCAYRLLYEGRPLPPWHPLVTGDVASVVQSGISVASWAFPERDVPEELIEEHILDDPSLFE